MTVQKGISSLNLQNWFEYTTKEREIKSHINIMWSDVFHRDMCKIKNN